MTRRTAAVIGRAAAVVARAAALSLAVLAVAISHAGAQLAPYHRWRTLETPHFHVHVRAGLEAEGRAAAAAAERAYAQLSTELVPPRGTVDLVLSDDADYSNGSATPFPSNRIIIYATPPIETQSLRFNEDWLALVITHELTHIFHLDRARGVWKLAQAVFGRGPDLFPNEYGPSWFTEGLAVYYESRFTEGGRLKDSEHKLLAQTSALEHRLPQLNELSLATPLFPGGERAYGYGSLLVDYLSRTRGDTTIRKFVDIQSAELIPYRMNHVSERAFGISFKDAFKAWSDSVQLSVGASRPPLTGWRELTTNGYYASDPRWLNDSTLTYVASDGRSSTAQYRLSLNGTRQSLGRRNTLGASVPLPSGGLLFAQVEYASRSEVRSDLFIERGGEQHQLTHGMRLVQPDVARDGRIVAAQLGTARTSLVLLDSAGKLARVLRAAGADETWSEPRWSPDGKFIAASHRLHGGVYSIEVIDLATDAARIVDRGRYLISTPSWSRDGEGLLYTSEASGTPVFVRRSIATLAAQSRVVSSATVTPSENLLAPEVSPSGALIAAATLRADGYHIGVAPAPSSGSAPNVSEPARSTAGTADGSASGGGGGGVVGGAASPDTSAAPAESLAAGNYHSYHAWRSLVPRYWYPIIEDAPGRGTRLGAKTSGSDVLGRHGYNAYLTIPTTGAYPTAGLSYRYSGSRRALIDVAAYQDYTLETSLLNGGTRDTVGSLLRQTRDASIAATFVRARIRGFSAFSFGIGSEFREYVSDPGEFLKQLDSAFSRRYTFPRAFVSAQWSNTRRPILSISPEDGISLTATARERARADSIRATTSTSIVGTASLYKSLDFPGFAHHVLALRVAAGAADNHASTAFEIGGTSGSAVTIAPGYTTGEGRRTFGVRGFPIASISGTRALGGTAEYRLPVFLGGAGFGSLPFFFDRSSISFFTDAATASCGANTRFAVCSPKPLLGQTIASAGSELVLSGTFIDWDVAQLFRLGLAVPVAGRNLVRANTVSVYVAYGLSF